jgi:16S rRNA (guanine966-N2)-methyltransferase
MACIFMGQRIIGGRLKGKKLFPIRGAHIRPTGDRQREAVFNILSDKIGGAAVLDLYAGTGALGLEALSRGASTCIFIDDDKSAGQVIARNIHACRLETDTQLIRWNIEKNLRCLHRLNIVFDVVFMDPPYRSGLVPPTLRNLNDCGCLKTGSILVIEHAAEDTFPAPDNAYTCYDQRRYGKTLVSFLRYMILFVVTSNLF